MLEILNNIDHDLFIFLNGLNNDFFDVIMQYISGKLTWIPLYAFLLYLVIRKHKWKALWFVLFVIVLITISDQTSLFFKHHFERLRPCHDPELESMVHYFRCGGKYSFFSAHASNTFALASFVFLSFRERKYLYLRIIFIVFASLNAYSRVYLGVHFPGDVLFGAFMGIIIGSALGFLWLYTYKKLP